VSVSYAIENEFAFNGSEVCEIQTGVLSETKFEPDLVAPGFYRSGSTRTDLRIGQNSEAQRFEVEIREGRIQFINKAEDTPMYCDSTAYFQTPQVEIVYQVHEEYQNALKLGKRYQDEYMKNMTMANLVKFTTQAKLVNETYAKLNSTISALPENETVAMKFAGNATEINMIHNNFTGSTSAALAMDNGSSSNSGGSSPAGSTAGIVVGVLVLLSIVVLLVVFRKTIAEKMGMSENTHSPPVSKQVIDEETGHQGYKDVVPNPSSEYSYKDVAPNPTMLNNNSYKDVAPEKTARRPPPPAKRPPVL
jgi:hypothetical protein